jgi:hypothetical protein
MRFHSAKSDSTVKNRNRRGDGAEAPSGTQIEGKRRRRTKWPISTL